MAGLGSVVVGFAHVTLKVAKNEGGGARTLFQAFRSRPRHLVALAVIDFLGGLTVALAGYLAGATEPQRLIEITNTEPLKGWLLVGGLGPVLAGRVFTGGLVRGRFEAWTTPGVEDHADANRSDAGVADEAWRMRIEITETLEDAVWARVSSNLEARAANYRRQLRPVLRSESGCRSFVKHVDRYFSSKRRRRMPDSVEAQLNFVRQTDGSSGATFKVRVQALSDACIDEGLWDIADAALLPPAGT